MVLASGLLSDASQYKGQPSSEMGGWAMLWGNMGQNIVLGRSDTGHRTESGNEGQELTRKSRQTMEETER